MRKKAWTFQRASQVEKHGTKKAAWYVGWLDPKGKRRQKSCGPGRQGKRLAEQQADEIHNKLVKGEYDDNRGKTWEVFRQRFEELKVSRASRGSAEATRQALNHFERIVQPTAMSLVDAEAIDEFRARRSNERGRHGNVSPATVNKELRYIRAALRKAKAWKFIDEVPEIEFEKKPDKLPTFVPAEHFTAIFRACDHATLPGDVRNVSAAAWWRALVVTCYLTGWRIGQIMALRWDDVDLENETAVSQAEDNKGRRDVRLPLHPAIAAQLRKLTGSFDSHVFPWNHNRRTLWTQFHQIQAAAIVVVVEDGREVERPLPKAGKEGWYGFHDLRRGFATENAANMDLFELQALMQHKSLETTRGYVSMAQRLSEAVGRVKVPVVLSEAVG